MILNTQDNAILSEYSHDFEKDGINYRAEIKCFEKPIKKSQATGMLFSALYIFKNGVLVRDFYFPDFVDDKSAANTFADVEKQIDSLVPKITNETSGE